MCSFLAIYSAVHLVRHKDSHHLFALKRILKKHIIMRNQVDQVCHGYILQ